MTRTWTRAPGPFSPRTTSNGCGGPRKWLTLRNASALQVALAFVLGQEYPVVALVGPSKVENLHGALGALEVELTPDEMRYLDLET